MKQKTHGYGFITGALLFTTLILFYPVRPFGNLFSFFWPVWVSFMLTWSVLWGRKKQAALTIPGVVITITGVILLLQNLAYPNETKSYVWGLFPVLVGLRLMSAGTHRNSMRLVKAGLVTTALGLILTALLGSILSGVYVTRVEYVKPIALISIGIVLLMGKAVEKTKRKNDAMDGKAKRKRGIDEALSEAEL
jgi:hypothetical protein